MHCGKKGVVVKRFNEIGDRLGLYRRVPDRVVVVRRTYDDAGFRRNDLELLLDFEAAHTWHEDINDRESHSIAETYARKTSGSLNNFACKSSDESKRLSAFTIEGSSSTRQIMPAAGGKTAHELTSIFFLRVKRQRER